MTETLEQAILLTVLKAMYERRILTLTCLDPGGEGVKERTVEPYSVIENKGDRMIRGYQLSPSQGWVLLDLRTISAVCDTGKAFSPRRPLRFDAGGLRFYPSLSRGRTPEQTRYRQLVLDAVADLEISQEEVRRLAQFRKQWGLTPDEVRGVHLGILSASLAAIVEDDLVSEEEAHQVKELNRCLNACLAESA